MDCVTFTPALWSLLLMSVTVVFGFSSQFSQCSCLMSGSFYSNSCFFFQDIPNCSTGYAFSVLSQPQYGLHFPQRQLSGFIIGLFSQAKLRAQAKSKYKKISNRTIHIWPTRNTCQSHDSIFLLT